MWNKRLEITVNTRTMDLKRTKDSLEELNNQLSATNRQLAAANEQLKVHDKMQREFINIASHEIKTPTQALLGCSEILEASRKKRTNISSNI
jgi:signal transduction histidine kinase